MPMQTFVILVLPLTRTTKSVVTGQAPATQASATLERTETPGKIIKQTTSGIRIPATSQLKQGIHPPRNINMKSEVSVRTYVPGPYWYKTRS